MPAPTWEASHGLTPTQANQDVRDHLQTIAGAKIIAGHLLEQLYDSIDSLMDERRRGEKDGEVKISPDKPLKMQVKIGNEVVYEGVKGQAPTIDKFTKSDAEYCKTAFNMSEGQTNPAMKRDVEVKLKGETLFKMEGGNVKVNKLSDSQVKAINLNFDQEPVAKQTVEAKPFDGSSFKGDVIDADVVQNRSPSVSNQPSKLPEPPKIITVDRADTPLVHEYVQHIVRAEGTPMGEGTTTAYIQSGSEMWQLNSNLKNNHTKIIDGYDNPVFEHKGGETLINHLSSQQSGNVFDNYTRIQNNPPIVKPLYTPPTVSNDPDQLHSKITQITDHIGADFGFGTKGYEAQGLKFYSNIQQNTSSIQDRQGNHLFRVENKPGLGKATKAGSVVTVNKLNAKQVQSIHSVHSKITQVHKNTKGKGIMR